jgi:hypothetical protein
MKRIYYLLATLVLCMFNVYDASGQIVQDGKTIGITDSLGRNIVLINAHDNAPDNQGTFSISVGGMNVYFGKKEPQKTYWEKLEESMFKSTTLGIFEIGAPMWTGASYSAYPKEEWDFMNLNWRRSVAININLLQFNANLNKSGSLGLSVGFGVGIKNLAFEKPLTIETRDFMVRPVAIDESYKLSKFVTYSSTIPILLEYRFKENFFAAGVIVDLYTNGYNKNQGPHTKIKFPKEKKYFDPYVNPVQLSGTLRCGWGPLYYFFNYNFSQFFQRDRGPKMQLCSFGVGWRLF